MKKLNQKGFGIGEVLLILLLILLIIAAGWWVWKQKDSNKPADSASQQQSQQPAEKSAEKPKEAAKKYLEIPELGVKMELTATTDDAYYVMKNGYAYVSLTSLKTANAECAADKTGVAAIGKYTKTAVDEQSGKTYEAEVTGGASGVVIGNNAFILNRSQAYCSDDMNVQAKQQAAWNAFLTQGKTIQAL